MVSTLCPLPLRLSGMSTVSACIHLLFSAFGSWFGSALRRCRNDHAVTKNIAEPCAHSILSRARKSAVSSSYIPRHAAYAGRRSLSRNSTCTACITPGACVSAVPHTLRDSRSAGVAAVFIYGVVKRLKATVRRKHRRRHARQPRQTPQVIIFLSNRTSGAKSSTGGRK